VSMLVNVSPKLAAGVAQGLGIAVPAAMPRAIAKPPKPEVTLSPTLSLTARPGDGGIRTRKVALLIADGIDGASLGAVKAALMDAGASPVLVGQRLGAVTTVSGDVLQADATMESEAGVVFDALVLPDGEAGVKRLAADAHCGEYIKMQYRHCKTILALGASSELLDGAGASRNMANGSPDPGIVVGDSGNADSVAAEFIAAMAMHRHWPRETDPPMV